MAESKPIYSCGFKDGNVCKFPGVLPTGADQNFAIRLCGVSESPVKLTAKDCNEVQVVETVEEQII